MTREQVNCSSQKLPTTGIRTRDLWFRSLSLRPLDQLVDNCNNVLTKYFICIIIIISSDNIRSAIYSQTKQPDNLYKDTYTFIL
jgi:hypothetical protein